MTVKNKQKKKIRVETYSYYFVCQKKNYGKTPDLCQVMPENVSIRLLPLPSTIYLPG